MFDDIYFENIVDIQNTVDVRNLGTKNVNVVQVLKNIYGGFDLT